MKKTVLTAVLGLKRSVGLGVMKSGLAKMAILVLLAMVAFARPSPAAISAVWGYVNARNWEVVYDWEVQEWIDEYFEDGSKGDGTVTSNIAMYFTQCFGGDWMENFNATPWECGFVAACDNVVFTNAAIHAANVAGKKSTFKGYHDDAALELKPHNNSTTENTIEQMKAAHAEGVKGKAADEKPLTQGSNRPLFGNAGTHVLVWMSHPHNLDQKDIENIVENYAPYVPAANITVLAGTGTGKYVDGAANKKNLLDAIKAIGAKMDDQPNSQFVFFVGDHGGAQWGSHEVPIVVLPGHHTTLLSMLTGQIYLKDHLPSPEALASVQLASTDEWADPSQLTVKLVSGEEELLAVPLDDPAVVVGTLEIPLGETTAVATSYQIPIENEILLELDDMFSIELVNESPEEVTVHFSSVSTGSIERAPAAGANLAAAFAFGARQLECPTFNEPTVNYTMVYHGSPAELEYQPERGWGYEVLYPTDSPYGERGGYGIFGPFDDSPNDREEFPDECPEELYDSFIGAKDFTNECSAATIGQGDWPCAPTINPEGIVFRVDVPNGLYRFVGAFGDADNPHAHRIIAEDGGSGPPENIGPNHVVLVSNHDQAQYDIGEADAVNLGDGVFARVGFEGKIPPPGDGVAPSPQFVDMDEDGMPTDTGPSSPVLEVTQGYIRIHQLQGNSNDGLGGGRDANGGDIVILELWRIGPAEPVCPTELVGVDIGGAEPAGTVEAVAICWRITAGGRDIWDTADQFYYAYAPDSVYGDFTAVVGWKGRQPMPTADEWAKAGIMARQNLEPGSPHVMVVGTPGNSVAFQGRDVAGGESWHTPVGGGYGPEETVWLRLDRVGDTFVGSYAIGGEMPPEVWIASAFHEVAFDDAQVGLATTSHEQGVPIEATYTDLCIGPYVGPPVLMDPELPEGPAGGDGFMGIREVIDNEAIGDQGTCYASLASGMGTIVDYDAGVLNIQDSGGNGHFGNDDVFGVVTVGHRGHGDVDDLSMIARGAIRIPAGQGTFWTFGVNSDDGFTLQLPGQNFISAVNGEIVNFESGAAIQFYGGRGTADTLGVIELLPGDYPFRLTYHEGAVDAAVELFAAKGINAAFDPAIFKLVGHKSIGTVPIPGFCNEVTVAASLPGVWGQIDSVQDAMDAVAEGEAHGTNSQDMVPIVNHSDPEDGAADPDASGSFGADLVFPNDRPGDDDDFAVMVEGLLDIPAAGTYQIGFNSDDGAGIQIFGHQWKSIVPGSDATAVIAGDVDDWLITDALTGWSWTAGEIEFAAPGCYEFRAIMFERGGGSFFELFGRGISPTTGKPDPSWHLLEVGGAGMYEDPDGLQLVAPPVVECFPSTYPAYEDWLALGKPDCWCWPYQCDGDVDGATETFFKYRIFGNDLAAVVENWKKKADDPTLNPCADVDHKAETFFKYRVLGKDLAKVVSNWTKKDGDLPGDCPRLELTIEQLKQPGWEKYVGEIVTVEGIFVCDPLPMLVTDLDIVKVNMRPPEDHYIILTGNQAEEIEPEQYGGAKLRLTGVVNMAGGDNDDDDVLAFNVEHAELDLIAYKLVEQLEKYSPKLAYFETHPVIPQPDRYAILFSGGVQQAYNYARYWNDLKFMYSTLINKCGYAASNIAVLYADGKAPKDPNTGKPDAQMPVHYSGTQVNLETVFNLLKGITTNQDSVFLFTTNHGGGFCKAGCKDVFGVLHYDDLGGQVDGNSDEPGTDIIKEADYKKDYNGDGFTTGTVSWDEELCAWKGSIYDDAFANMFANLKYDKMVIVMEQCFSGGLIADMAGTNRIIMSAASEYEPSYAMDYGQDANDYDAFSYHFTCAVNEAYPGGQKVNADTNKDGKVSMVEAFNYAVSEDQKAETPHYEDSGDGNPQTGLIPVGGKGGDGKLGEKTFLN